MDDFFVSDIPIIDMETFLAMNDAGRQLIGDSALHKNKGRNSDKTWKKMVDYQNQKDSVLCDKREQLRQEYEKMVENGEIRPPSRFERLIRVANGMDDLESVQTARRLLLKRNIDWELYKGK